jgi:SAM-dependent methyltransferase
VDEGRTRWTERHREQTATKPPSPFVADALARLGAPEPGALALDVACGQGRHALLLAEHGYHVIALDWALPALTTLAHTARERALRVSCLAADAATCPIPRDHFAVVLATNFLERSLLPILRAAVAPGGTLLLETFLAGQERHGHPTNPDYLLHRGELAALVAGWGVVTAHEGESTRDGAPVMMAGIAARRPASRVLAI